jgi:uncharacterized membrane protein
MQVGQPTLATPIPVSSPALRVGSVCVRSPRLECVDLLRGAVMILMALDHCRDFFTSLVFAPESLSRTTAALFFTRFVTHFCAPVFFLLAGTSGALSLAQGKSRLEVSRFYLTRGLWLVVLNLTVVAFAWTFTVPFLFAGVLWSLGWSMVLMALLLWLPVPWIAVFGTLMIVTHNLFDSMKPETFGRFGPLVLLLHGHGLFAVDSERDPFFVLFSIVPWVGVMAAGFALGALHRRKDWRKLVFGIGAAVMVSFLVLRFFHLYGNSHGDPGMPVPGVIGPWRSEPTLTLSVISFFDTLKYPPSLQFLLMTLGPALMVLPWLDKVKAERGIWRFLLVFGRVPLFYYVVHLYAIHLLSILVAWLTHQPVAWLLDGATMVQRPPDHYGHGLPFIYLMWMTVVVGLYLPCRWFMELKRRRPGWWWLRYL